MVLSMGGMQRPASGLACEQRLIANSPRTLPEQLHHLAIPFHTSAAACDPEAGLSHMTEAPVYPSQDFPSHSCDVFPAFLSSG